MIAEGFRSAWRRARLVRSNNSASSESLRDDEKCRHAEDCSLCTVTAPSIMTLHLAPHPSCTTILTFGIYGIRSTDTASLAIGIRFERQVDNETTDLTPATPQAGDMSGHWS